MSSFTPEEQEAAWYMLDELKQRRLRVVKVRTEDGWKRIPNETNAEWYQDFCKSYMGVRKRYPKVRTMIRRKHTITALKSIISGKIHPTNQYVERLRPFIESFIECHLSG